MELARTSITTQQNQDMNIEQKTHAITRGIGKGLAGHAAFKTPVERIRHDTDWS
jgi:hypothetical protein